MAETHPTLERKRKSKTSLVLPPLILCITTCVFPSTNIILLCLESLLITAYVGLTHLPKEETLTEIRYISLAVLGMIISNLALITIAESLLRNSNLSSILFLTVTNMMAFGHWKGSYRCNKEGLANFATRISLISRPIENTRYLVQFLVVVLSILCIVYSLTRYPDLQSLVIGIFVWCIVLRETYITQRLIVTLLEEYNLEKKEI